MAAVSVWFVTHEDPDGELFSGPEMFCSEQEARAFINEQWSQEISPNFTIVLYRANDGEVIITGEP